MFKTLSIVLISALITAGIVLTYGGDLQAKRMIVELPASESLEGVNNLLCTGRMKSSIFSELRSDQTTYSLDGEVSELQLHLELDLNTVLTVTDHILRTTSFDFRDNTDRFFIAEKISAESVLDTMVLNKLSGLLIRTVTESASMSEKTPATVTEYYSCVEKN